MSEYTAVESKVLVACRVADAQESHLREFTTRAAEKAAKHIIRNRRYLADTITDLERTIEQLVEASAAVLEDHEERLALPYTKERFHLHKIKVMDELRTAHDRAKGVLGDE